MPSRVVAFGGGTGLPAILRGLRSLVTRGVVDDLIAVVTMTDDGGSSGRLRRSRGMPPPGDLRNCLVALAAEEDLMARLFQHRYGGTEELGGHAVGNLILAALAEQTGCFLKAVELSSRVLRVVGRILPATLDSVTLEATMEDGSVLAGETRITTSGKRIRRMALQPSPAQPTPGVVEAIEAADLVVLGPGSLYTSVIPNLLAEGVGPALRETRAAVVMVTNLVGEREETAGLNLDDHVRIVEEHAGGRIVDAVVTHDGAVDSETATRYEAEGCFPLQWTSRAGDDLIVVRRNLLARAAKMRHDPAATSEALMAAWRRFTQAEVMRNGEVAARSHDRGGRRWVPRSITN